MKSNLFIHLHNHSDYSRYQGMIKVKELVKTACEMGMPSVALTDTGFLYGAVEFYKECLKNKIKPIIGCEFQIHNDPFPPGTIVLLAVSKNGYDNLMQLSFSYSRNNYLEMDDLKNFSSDLICLSGGLEGIISQLMIHGKLSDAEELAIIFQSIYSVDNFYLEIQLHGLSEEEILTKKIQMISNTLWIPLVATNNCHYLSGYDSEAQSIYTKLNTLKSIRSIGLKTDQYDFKSPGEMENLFQCYPEAITNTSLIADRCNLLLDFPGYSIPRYHLPENQSSQNYLQEIALQGLTSRYPEITPTLKSKLESELKMIHESGFDDLFLILWDLIQFIKKKDIPMSPGERNSIGSLASYCLELTQIDPVNKGLYFEMFINKKTGLLPDYVLGICQDHHEEVINYLQNKYSPEKVTQVTSFTVLTGEKVLRKVGKVLNIPDKRLDYLIRQIPENERNCTSAWQLNSRVISKIREKGREIERNLFFIADRLIGLNDQKIISDEIVVSSENLQLRIPMEIVSSDNNKAVSQYSGNVTEECGSLCIRLKKMNVLTQMKKCIDLIKPKNPNFNLNIIPMSDRNVFKQLSKGNTKGIFYLDNKMFKIFLKRIQPESIEDLMVTVPLYYSTFETEFIDTYSRLKYFKKSRLAKYPFFQLIFKIWFKHLWFGARDGNVEMYNKYIKDSPDLNSNRYFGSKLQETYGLLIYQEQIIRLVCDIAGYSPADAEVYRRALYPSNNPVLSINSFFLFYGIKNPPPPYSPIKGGIPNGYTENYIQQFLFKIERWGKYCYSKSHIFGVMTLAYQTAFLKYYYPTEFQKAFIDPIHSLRPDKSDKY